MIYLLTDTFMENKLLSNLMAAFFVFVSISIALSLLTGFFWRNSFFIAAVSIALTFLVFKKLKFSVGLSFSKWLVAVIVIFILFEIYPQINAPGFPLTADAVTTTVVRTIGDKIPSTYAPYTNLSLYYLFGFHFFGKMITDIIPFVADYTTLWFLGLLFAALQFVLIHNITLEFFKSRNAADLSAILLLGTRQIIQFTFWGMGPMLLAIDLFLFSFYLFQKNNKLFVVFFAANILMHPLIFGMQLVAFLLYAAINKRLKELVKPVIAAAILSPLVFNLYIGNLLTALNKETLIFAPAAGIFLATALYFGIVPLIFFLSSLCTSLKEKAIKNRQNIFLLSTALLFSIIYFAFYLTGSRFFDLLFIPVTLFGVVFASQLASKFKIKSSFYKLAVIFIVLSVLFTSSEITKIAKGKASIDEYRFGIAFKSFDPNLEKALFISKAGGWIAHVSNKVPYDLINSNFIVPFASSSDAIWSEVKEMAATQKQIESGCADCISKTGVKYIVVNKKYSNLTLAKDPVFTYGDFVVYLN